MNAPSAISLLCAVALTVSSGSPTTSVYAISSQITPFSSMKRGGSRPSPCSLCAMNLKWSDSVSTWICLEAFPPSRSPSDSISVRASGVTEIRVSLLAKDHPTRSPVEGDRAGGVTSMNPMKNG